MAKDDKMKCEMKLGDWFLDERLGDWFTVYSPNSKHLNISFLPRNG